jgi:hypothetical protein
MKYGLKMVYGGITLYGIATAILSLGVFCPSYFTPTVAIIGMCCGVASMLLSISGAIIGKVETDKQTNQIKHQISNK